VRVDAPSVAPAQAKLPFDPQLIDLMKSADARRLFELEQLEVSWDDPTGTLWTFMRPRGRPSYNLDFLEDFHAWQRGIVAAFEHRPNDLRYLLLGSRTPGVFNLGGDLDLFAAKIRARDREALVAYGESCVRILHRNINCLGLPMLTIGLAQGDALGGGFESLLSFNIIIAERGAKFGFPENIFGLFPGMGAYSLVARREQFRRCAYLCVAAAVRNRQNQLRPSSLLWPVATRRARENAAVRSQFPRSVPSAICLDLAQL
jgi:DSF synthase